MTKVKKRSGRIQLLDKKKIVKAIKKAEVESMEVDSIKEEVIDEIIERIENCGLETIDVDSIHNLIVSVLKKNGYDKVSETYSEYSLNKKKKKTSEILTKAFEKAKFNETPGVIMKAMRKLVGYDAENQNANVDANSFGGRNGECNSVIAKHVAFEYLVSEITRRNHDSNRSYVHDADSYADGRHNCFERKTRFVTKDGIKSFENFGDGEKTIVLDKDGNWREATVKCFGNDGYIQDIVFERKGKEVVVGATTNHRWYLKDGSVTTSIKVGDCLYLGKEMNESVTIDNADDANWWCLGFVIGDGLVRKERGTTEVRLCGDKSKYSEIFDMAYYTKRKDLPNGDKCYSKKLTTNKQEFLDYRLWKLLPYKAKRLLFEGYYAADGIKSGSTRGCDTADVRVVEFIEDLCVLSGYHIFNKKFTIKSNGYKDNAELYHISLTTHQDTKSPWRVKSITKRKNWNEPYWCVVEPITHSFTLEHGIVTGNCLSFPLDDKLESGVITRQSRVRPARSINSALQLVAVYFQLQSLDQFGGVSATHLDWTLVPYFRMSFMKNYKIGCKYLRDTVFETDMEKARTQSIDDKSFYSDEVVYRYAYDMTVHQTYQAVESMYHNLNTLQSRSGNQLPFTSINYGTNTTTEGRIIIRALLEKCIEGTGPYGQTSIFPCGIFQVMSGVNKEKGTPNYDLFRLALKSTSQRIYPNYANVDWSGNKGYDINDPRTYFSTMGCRTANGWDINGFGQLKDGRGNIAPQTIILPTLAMEAEGDVEKFFVLLEKTIEETRDSLLERFEWVCSQKPESAPFMYTNGTMYGYVPEEGIRSALKHGTLAIGQLGLAETLQILIGTDHSKINKVNPEKLKERIRKEYSYGEQDEEYVKICGYIDNRKELDKELYLKYKKCEKQLKFDTKGMRLAQRIEQLFKDKCAEYKEQYKLNFGVYYTPAENLCYTAMQKFKEKYGVIKNVSDREYFTNSIHVPVWKKITAFDKIELESMLTGYSSAGCITYVELESSVYHNIDALEKLVVSAMDNDIPYFAINIPIDYCPKCHHQGDMNGVCPYCGNDDDLEELRRITGYLSTSKKHFNLGKQEETDDRAKHIVEF